MLSVGDFLTTWAVELAVHHVDLGRELDVGQPVPDALALNRQTVAALLGTPVPDDVPDLDVLLVGAGRQASTARDGVRRVFG